LWVEASGSDFEPIANAVGAAVPMEAGVVPAACRFFAAAAFTFLFAIQVVSSCEHKI